MPDFIACQSFAGGMDMGMTKAGWTMIHKVEQVGGFGLPNVEAQRHLLGNNWGSQAVEPQSWEVMPAHVVVGNPPCSRPDSRLHRTKTSAAQTRRSTRACGRLSTTFPE